MTERGIAWFNSLPVEEAEEELYRCFADRDWAARVVALRPFRDADALVAAGDGELPDPADAVWEQVILSHPRIGERGGHAPAKSEREQSQVMDAPPEVLADLAAENRRYEARFGRPFIIFAAGRSAQEILDRLRQRINLDPLIEFHEVQSELGEITRHRLRTLVDR